jgi:hypothetical protein
MPIQRKKDKKDPDAPYCDSKRPSKHDLETRVVNWAVSTAKNGAQWTDEEQITIIRAKERSNLDWQTIARLFPGRHGHAVERRYKKHLVKSKVCYFTFLRKLLGYQMLSSSLEEESCFFSMSQMPICTVTVIRHIR